MKLWHAVLRECFPYNIFEFPEEAEEPSENFFYHIDTILMKRKTPKYAFI